MAVIHRTSLSPGKLELLAGWLPGQPWYVAGQPSSPSFSSMSAHAALSRAGGFRLDDPADRVGIEFFVALDGAGGDQVSYLVPLTYRDAPVAGLEAALIGVSEHGVLGTRWVYDGAHDPVMVSALLALMVGDAIAQSQTESNTIDQTVTAHWPYPAVTAAGSTVSGHDARSTLIDIETDGAPVRLRLIRRPAAETPATQGEEGYVSAAWQLPGGATTRRHVVTAGLASR